MLGRRLARPVAALSVTVLLAGCFPPFFPWDPTLFPPLGDDAIVVHNETDEAWVVAIDSAGPTAFAVPADASGEMPLWGLEPTGARLLDVECAEVDALELEGAPAGDGWALTIGEGGVLSLAEPGGSDDALPALVEYYDCFGAGVSVEPGEPVPGATGSLVVQGEDGGLWSVDVATGQATVLVGGDPELLGSGHALSPDGTRVAFSTWDVDGIESAISVADVDGANERLLVENGTFPSWSPDRARIAYLDTDPFAGGSALSVIDAEGGEPRRLAPAASWLAWSPDGTRIAFITDATNDFSSEMPEAGTLSVVDVEDGTVTELAPTAPYSSMPAWSPDGAQIAFTGGTFDTTDLRVVDADGGEDRVVSDGDGASLAEPAWAPDGSRLAAVGYSLGFVSTTSSIVIVDPTGAEPDRVLVTSTEDTHYTPAWSPDGAWLAHTRSDADYRSSVVVVNLETGDETVVARSVFAISGWLAR